MTEDRLPPPAEKTRLITWLDVVIIGSVATLLILTYYRVEHVLVYNWNWGLVFQYLVHIDEVTGEVFPNLFLKGVAMTLRLAFWGTVIAGIIGIVMGLCRVSNSLFLKLGSRIYVELIRNIPPVVFIFVFYFFISSQIIPLLGLDRIKDITDPTAVAVIELLFGPLDLFENFLAGLICLAVFESAYITEIVRAGIQSIDKGQWEAARAIGLSRFFVFWDVILPQALKTILPPLAGQFITLVKDSSIVSLISVQELTFLTQDVSNTTTHFFESWMITAVLYFAMCFPLAVLFQRFERVGIGIQRQ